MFWVRHVDPHALHETVVQLFRSATHEEAYLRVRCGRRVEKWREARGLGRGVLWMFLSRMFAFTFVFRVESGLTKLLFFFIKKK
jgi:hypothetical protein